MLADWFIEHKGPNVGLLIEKDSFDSILTHNTGKCISTTFVKCFNDFDLLDEGFDKCDIVGIQMKDIKPKTVGWMYPKGSVLQPLFDSYWLKLYQNGVIEKLYQRFLPPPICPNKDSYYEVNFEFAGMIFYLLILGLLLAIIVGIGEKIKAKLQKKRHSKTNVIEVPPQRKCVSCSNVKTSNGCCNSNS